MQPSRDIARLIEIVEALRQPETGCPWDKEQTLETIVPYTIEEAYEAADAIARGDMADLKDELGDLLLQVVFHSRIAEEQAYFDFGSVVEAITQKMIRRHPHVFAKSQDLTPEERKALWSAIKAEEKKAKDEARRGHPGANFLPGGRTEGGLLDDIPVTLPGLTRAVKLQAKAATVGFDWNDSRLVLEKIREETIAAALEAGDQQALEKSATSSLPWPISPAIFKRTPKRQSCAPILSLKGASGSSRKSSSAKARRLPQRG
jgi:nucleoside triphosphate diphosphatase